jgi:hypothetical protein
MPLGAFMPMLTAEEIDESERLLASSERLTNTLISPYETINTMLIRYISVLSKINDNENAKAILNHTIMDKINDQLSNTVATTLDESYKNLLSQKLDFIRKHIWNGYRFNRFTDTKVSDVLSSLSNVLLAKDYDNEWPYRGLTSVIELLTAPDKEDEREAKNKRYKTAADPRFFYR